MREDFIFLWSVSPLLIQVDLFFCFVASRLKRSIEADMSDPGRSRGRARGRTREEAAEPARRPAEVAQRPGEPNLVAPVAVVTPQPVSSAL